MKPRCKCNSNKKLFKCIDFDENERKAIFYKFWRMTWKEKKSYVSLLIDIKDTYKHRDRKIDDISRRSNAMSYHLKKNEKSLKVCKTMFLNTLAIAAWSVIYVAWIKEYVRSTSDVQR